MGPLITFGLPVAFMGVSALSALLENRKWNKQLDLMERQMANQKAVSEARLDRAIAQGRADIKTAEVASVFRYNLGKITSMNQPAEQEVDPAARRLAGAMSTGIPPYVANQELPQNSPPTTGAATSNPANAQSVRAAESFKGAFGTSDLASRMWDTHLVTGNHDMNNLDTLMGIPPDPSFYQDNNVYGDYITE